MILLSSEKDGFYECLLNDNAYPLNFPIKKEFFCDSDVKILENIILKYKIDDNVEFEKYDNFLQAMVNSLQDYSNLENERDIRIDLCNSIFKIEDFIRNLTSKFPLYFENISSKKLSINFNVNSDFLNSENIKNKNKINFQELINNYSKYVKNYFEMFFQFNNSIIKEKLLELLGKESIIDNNSNILNLCIDEKSKNLLNSINSSSLKDIKIIIELINDIDNYDNEKINKKFKKYLNFDIKEYLLNKKSFYSVKHNLLLYLINKFYLISKNLSQATNSQKDSFDVALNMFIKTINNIIIAFIESNIKNGKFLLNYLNFHIINNKLCYCYLEINNKKLRQIRNKSIFKWININKLISNDFYSKDRKAYQIFKHLQKILYENHKLKFYKIEKKIFWKKMRKI